MKRKQKI